jgi:ABC-2 type transport system ATP-binding protein
VSAIVVAEELSKQFILRHASGTSVKERVLAMTGRARGTRDEVFTALDRVNCAVQAGESIALVGRNGSGKSTLLKLVAGIHQPSAGRLLVRVGVRIATMIELGVGFHPDLTGRENVYLNAAIHGLTRKQIDAIYPAVVRYSELERFVDTPIKTYSSGMVMRLGFAIAVNLDPDVFLLDEIFAVGDEAFQHKCLASMQAFQERGKTMFFVSHAAEAVREMCRRALVLDGGRVVFDGDVDPALIQYRLLLNEQTRGMVRGAPAPDQPVGEPWHRRAMGGRWDTEGPRQLAFLREQGLKPADRLLELGCGSLRAGVALLQYLDAAAYVGVDTDQTLIDAAVAIELPRARIDPNRGQFLVGDARDLSAVEGSFDVILAVGLLQSLPTEGVARTFAAAIRRLAPRGRFFAAYFEAPSAASLEPIERPGPCWSHFDQPPYHHDFETLRRLADACGGVAERMGEWGDPHGQMMMVIRRAGDHAD